MQQGRNSGRSTGDNFGALDEKITGIGTRLDDHIGNVDKGFVRVEKRLDDIRDDNHRDNDELKQQVATLSETFVSSLKDVLTNYATKERVEGIASELKEVKAQSQVTHDKVTKWGGGIAVALVLIGVAEPILYHVHW